MLTIKQIQAFYWVARLGTLSKAADKLHITQSAATKRLQEVEAIAASPLFEKTSRKNLLTPKGQELLAECEKLFKSLDELELLKGTAQQPARIIRVGLTELTAMTWFGSFSKEMKKVYPAVTLQPELNLSSVLLKGIEEGRLDFAILPEPPTLDGLVRVELGVISFGWFAAPGVFESDKVHSLRELVKVPVIEHSTNSIIAERCAQLWGSESLQPDRIYGGNNINALAGLILAGVGVSCLPLVMFTKEVEHGDLHLLKTTPEAPKIPYYFCFLKHLNTAFGYTAADIAKNSFSLG
jgi:DNA-binding transcriptional LysR family regulator